MRIRSRACRAALAVGAVLALGVLGAGCGSDAEVVQQPDGAVKVHGTGKRATVSVGGENGATVTYNQQALPADFPSAVPRPDGLRLLTATSTPGGGYFQLTYAAPDPGTALTSYRAQLDGAGFTASGEPAGGGRVDSLEATGHGWTLTALGTGRGKVGVVDLAVARSPG